MSGHVRTGYIIALAAVLALLVLSRTRTGQSVVAGATDAVMSSIIGIRLNNPLNVERGEPWEGLASDQPHERFAKFVAMKYGIRAAVRILLTYRNKYGISTVEKIINRWNPIADGQPMEYIPNVANALGVLPKATIDVRDRATAFALVRAMIRQEIGTAAALLVSDADVHDGLSLAGIAA